MMIMTMLHAGVDVTRDMSGMQREVTVGLPCRLVPCKLPSCPQCVTCLLHAGADTSAVMPGRQPERHAGSPAAARAFGRWPGPGRVVHRHMDEAHGADVAIRDADMHDSMEGPDSLSALQVMAIVSSEAKHMLVMLCPVLNSCYSRQLG